MHEASLAMSLINSVLEIAEREKAKRVLEIKMRIGKLSGVVVDSFIFAFNAMKEEASKKLKNAKLLVEEVPVKYRCKNCNCEFEAETVYLPECPSCGSVELELLSGEEMEVVSVELEV